MMKRILLISLTITVLTNYAVAQENTVTVIGFGDGINKTTALNQALRNCIEKSMGTFLSSSTTVMNDSLVKDQIITIASGNIVSYDVLSEVNNKDNWNVSVSAVISPEKLITTLKAKGFNFELNGGVYAQNVLKEDFYRKQERPALENFINIYAKLSLFNFDIKLFEPKAIDSFRAILNSNSIDDTEINRALINISDSYKKYSIIAPSVKRVDDEFYLLDYDSKNGYYCSVYGGPSTDSDKYEMLAFFTPQITSSYISFVNSFLKLLNTISIKDIDSYKALNNECIRILIPDESMSGLAIEENNAGSYYLRDSKLKDIFKRLDDMLVRKSVGKELYSDELKKLSTQLYVKAVFHFFQPSEFPINYFLPFSKDKQLALTPSILRIYLTLNELQNLKNIEFKPKYGLAVDDKAKFIDEREKRMKIAFKEVSGDGEKKILGIKILDIDTKLIKEKNLNKKTTGVYVNELFRFRAASEAGIIVGDVITIIDGENINSTTAFIEKMSKSGNDILMTVMRDGKAKTFKIRLR